MQGSFSRDLFLPWFYVNLGQFISVADPGEGVAKGQFSKKNRKERKKEQNRKEEKRQKYGVYTLSNLNGCDVTLYQWRNQLPPK